MATLATSTVNVQSYLLFPMEIVALGRKENIQTSLHSPMGLVLEVGRQRPHRKVP